MINPYALKTLKALQKEGKNLNERQITQAESLITIVDFDLQRIGKENLSKDLNIQVDIETLTPVERMEYTMSKYQQQEAEKRANIS